MESSDARQKLALVRLGQLEMRVVDQADKVAEWVADRGDLDVLTDVLHRRNNDRACRDEVLDNVFDFANTPVCDATSTPSLAHRLVRIESQFVAGDIETNVERLVEIVPSPFITSGMAHLLRVLADAYIHELGEGETEVGVLMDDGGPRWGRR